MSKNCEKHDKNCGKTSQALLTGIHLPAEGGEGETEKDDEGDADDAAAAAAEGSHGNGKIGGKGGREGRGWGGGGLGKQQPRGNKSTEKCDRRCGK